MGHRLGVPFGVQCGDGNVDGSVFPPDTQLLRFREVNARVIRYWMGSWRRSRVQLGFLIELQHLVGGDWNNAWVG